MQFTPERAAQILNEARRIMAMDEADPKKLRRLWTTLAYIQGYDLACTLTTMLGKYVFGGPFKGMKLTDATLIGSFAPLLLGTYETELHPTIEEIVKQPYTTILNIGSGYGYYCIGFAMRMPHTKIYGFDTDEKERQRCADMMALNGVSDRIQNAGLFDGAKFADYADGKTLVFMDIEGGEMDLLDPARYPALKKMDVVVELHDLFNPAISKTMVERFSPTHDVKIIPTKSHLFDFQTIAPGGYVDPFDELLATWENRGGPTPWAVMRVKQ